MSFLDFSYTKIKEIIKFFRIDRNVYHNLFPGYIEELGKILFDCESLLDLGCGSKSPIIYFSKDKYCVGLDIYNPSIEKSKVLKIHNDYIRANVMSIEKIFDGKSFDAVIALDLIEHLSKENGLRLIK